MRQPRTYGTEAIVLKHSDLGEADRILTLFTPYRGKFHVIAKGMRRPISRKAGHLELLCHSQLQLAQGRNLDIVTQAQAIDSFLHMQQELWHMTCALYLSELVERFIEENTPHQDVYKLLLECLVGLEVDAIDLQQQRSEGRLDQEREYDRSLLILRYFEGYLLSSVGYEPVLRNCVHCDAELKPEENGFTPSMGGALCPNCAHLWAYPLSMNALKVLRLLQRSELKKLPRFHLEPRLHNEIFNAMRSLIRFHLERDLRSWSMLEELFLRRTSV